MINYLTFDELIDLYSVNSLTKLNVITKEYELYEDCYLEEFDTKWGRRYSFLAEEDKQINLFDVGNVYAKDNS